MGQCDRTDRVFQRRQAGLVLSFITIGTHAPTGPILSVTTEAQGRPPIPPCLLAINGGPSVARHAFSDWRRGPELNRRIEVLQTSALPLGYRAAHNAT